MSRENVYLSSDRVGSIGGYSIFCAPITSSSILKGLQSSKTPCEPITRKSEEIDPELEKELTIEEHFFENNKQPTEEQSNTKALKEAANLRPIYFALDSAVIRRSSMPKLHQVVQFLRKHPDIKIRIVGHADESGTAAHNLALSHRRSESIRRHLIDMGITPNRLETIGLGSTKPVVPRRDRSIDRFNRRVEFEVQQ